MWGAAISLVFGWGTTVWSMMLTGVVALLNLRRRQTPWQLLTMVAWLVAGLFIVLHVALGLFAWHSAWQQELVDHPKYLKKHQGCEYMKQQNYPNPYEGGTKDDCDEAKKALDSYAWLTALKKCVARLPTVGDILEVGYYKIFFGAVVVCALSAVLALSSVFQQKVRHAADRKREKAMHAAIGAQMMQQLQQQKGDKEKAL
jgi:hypothetical protein